MRRVLLAILGVMDIDGGIVLISPETDAAYAAPHDSLAPLGTYGEGILGGFVLIDPETDEPYTFS